MTNSFDNLIYRLRGALFLYRRYVGISMRGQMQYKLSFWLLTFGQFFATVVEILGICILFARFGSLRGWTLPQVALFYGLVNVAFAFADAFGRGFDMFPAMVKSGDFDRVLLRPRSTALQIGAQELLLTRGGRLLQAAVVLGLAMHALPVAWTVAKIALMIEIVVGGIALFTALYVLQATLAFWTIETLEIMNILTYGGTEIGQYPMSIYTKGFQRFFTFVIPVACLNIIPVRVLLGQPSPPLAWFAPLVGFVFLAVSMQIWRLGVRKYTSTGS
jgi:ABC-2 type transport system permease protein